MNDPRRPGSFIGRMQPPHREHIEMIGRLFLNHGHVFIGITNPEPAAGLKTDLAPHRDGAAGNPFAYDERQQLLRLALDADGVDMSAYSIVPFPLERSECWGDHIPTNALQYVRVFGPWEQTKVTLLARTYEVRVTTEEPKRCEGSQVRSELSAGRIPEAELHPATVGALKSLLEQRSYQERVAG